MCRASDVVAQLDPAALPVLGDEVLRLIERDCVPGGSRQNLVTAESFTYWGKATSAQKVLLTDAQTSGGLLLCVRPGRVAAVMQLLEKERAACRAVIGRMRRRRKGDGLVVVTSDA